MNGLFAAIGRQCLTASDQTGDVIVLFLQNLRESWNMVVNPHRVFVQMKRVGNDTLLIAAGISLFIGMVLSLQVGNTLERFNSESALASVIAYSMIKELGPVITALLLSGRIGASFAAELGTMQVNEEIDALHTLGISPVRYLAMPRFVACIAMLPLLVSYASLIGIVGGGVIANAYFDIGWVAYFDTAYSALELGDIMEMLVKSVLFGAIVACICCQRGFRTRGGAEGVGRAITSGVVACFISIIVCDYFVTRFML